MRANIDQISVKITAAVGGHELGIALNAFFIRGSGTLIYDPGQKREFQWALN